MTVLSRLAGPLLKLPPPGTRDISVERDLGAKMADGAVLLADRWFPTRPSGDVPTLLIRTPYGRRIMGPLGRLFAERGYQTVIQSCRGTFGSAGDWEPLRHERSDGHATLSWVAGQPWFDGRLVTWGASYLGMTQWAVAADAPDFLKAMALDVTAANAREAFVFPGGSFALEMALSWAYQIKYQELGIRTVLRTQLDSAKVVARAAEVLGAGVPVLARTQRTGRPVVGCDGLQSPVGSRAACELRGRLVRPLPGGTGCRLRSGPSGGSLCPPDHWPLEPFVTRIGRRDRS
jgi:predicted acyl esterase